MAGYGIASIFSNLFRAFRPVIKQAGRYAAQKMGETGVKIASDVMHGDSLRNSFKRRLGDVKDEVVSDSVKKLHRVMRGNGTTIRRKHSKIKNKLKIKAKKKKRKKKKLRPQKKAKKRGKGSSKHLIVNRQKRATSKTMHVHGDLF